MSSSSSPSSLPLFPYPVTNPLNIPLLHSLLQFATSDFSRHKQKVYLSQMRALESICKVEKHIKTSREAKEIHGVGDFIAGRIDMILKKMQQESNQSRDNNNDNDNDNNNNNNNNHNHSAHNPIPIKGNDKKKTKSPSPPSNKKKKFSLSSISPMDISLSLSDPIEDDDDEVNHQHHHRHNNHKHHNDNDHEVDKENRNISFNSHHVSSSSFSSSSSSPSASPSSSSSSSYRPLRKSGNFSLLAGLLSLHYENPNSKSFSHSQVTKESMQYFTFPSTVSESVSPPSPVSFPLSYDDESLLYRQFDRLISCGYIIKNISSIPYHYSLTPLGKEISKEISDKLLKSQSDKRRKEEKFKKKMSAIKSLESPTESPTEENHNSQGGERKITDFIPSFTMTNPKETTEENGKQSHSPSLSTSPSSSLLLPSVSPLQRLSSSSSSPSLSPVSLPTLSLISRPQYLSNDSFSNWDIILLVDNRERRSKSSSSSSSSSPDDDRRYICDQLTKNHVKCEVRMLPIGDFQWIARKKTNTLPSASSASSSHSSSSSPSSIDPLASSPSLSPSSPVLSDSSEDIVLNCLFERKKLSDLCSSIIDGRYHEQRIRMKGTFLSRVGYIIEGPIGNLHSIHSQRPFPIPVATIQSIISSLSTVHNFLSWESLSLFDTCSFLAETHKSLVEFYRNHGIPTQKSHFISSEIVPSDISLNPLDNSSNDEQIAFLLQNPSLPPPYEIQLNGEGESWSSWCFRNKKSNDLASSQIWSLQLRQIKGLSPYWVQQIIKKFPTPSSLYMAFDRCVSLLAEERMISNLFISSNSHSKSIGISLSKKIRKFFRQSKYSEEENIREEIQRKNDLEREREKKKEEKEREKEEIKRKKNENKIEEKRMRAIEKLQNQEEQRKQKEKNKLNFMENQIPMMRREMSEQSSASSSSSYSSHLSLSPPFSFVPKSSSFSTSLSPLPPPSPLSPPISSHHSLPHRSQSDFTSSLSLSIESGKSKLSSLIGISSSHRSSSSLSSYVPLSLVPSQSSRVNLNSSSTSSSFHKNILKSNQSAEMEIVKTNSNSPNPNPINSSSLSRISVQAYNPFADNNDMDHHDDDDGEDQLDAQRNFSSQFPSKYSASSPSSSTHSSSSSSSLSYLKRPLSSVITLEDFVDNSDDENNIKILSKFRSQTQPEKGKGKGKGKEESYSNDDPHHHDEDESDSESGNVKWEIPKEIPKSKKCKPSPSPRSFSPLITVKENHSLDEDGESPLVISSDEDEDKDGDGHGDISMEEERNTDQNDKNPPLLHNISGSSSSTSSSSSSRLLTPDKHKSNSKSKSKNVESFGDEIDLTSP